MSAQPDPQRTPRELLGFYENQLHDYRRYAALHQFGDWILLWVLILNGAAVAACLLFQAPPVATAGASLLLNFVLLAAKYIDPESKWACYRTTEIRMSFALQDMWTSVARLESTGTNRESAILESLTPLHRQVEKLVLDEFADFFAKVRSLQDIETHLSKKN